MVLIPFIIVLLVLVDATNLEYAWTPGPVRPQVAIYESAMPVNDHGQLAELSDRFALTMETNFENDCIIKRLWLQDRMHAKRYRLNFCCSQSMFMRFPLIEDGIRKQDSECSNQLETSLEWVCGDISQSSSSIAVSSEHDHGHLSSAGCKSLQRTQGTLPAPDWGQTEANPDARSEDDETIASSESTADSSENISSGQILNGSTSSIELAEWESIASAINSRGSSNGSSPCVSPVGDASAASSKQPLLGCKNEATAKKDSSDRPQHAHDLEMARNVIDMISSLSNPTVTNAISMEPDDVAATVAGVMKGASKAFKSRLKKMSTLSKNGSTPDIIAAEIPEMMLIGYRQSEIASDLERKLLSILRNEDTSSLRRALESEYHRLKQTVGTFFHERIKSLQMRLQHLPADLLVIAIGRALKNIFKELDPVIARALQSADERIRTLPRTSCSSSCGDTTPPHDEPEPQASEKSELQPDTKVFSSMHSTDFEESIVSTSDVIVRDGLMTCPSTELESIPYNDQVSTDCLSNIDCRRSSDESQREEVCSTLEAQHAALNESGSSILAMTEISNPNVTEDSVILEFVHSPTSSMDVLPKLPTLSVVTSLDPAAACEHQQSVEHDIDIAPSVVSQDLIAIPSSTNRTVIRADEDNSNSICCDGRSSDTRCRLPNDYNFCAVSTSLLYLDLHSVDKRFIDEVPLADELSMSSIKHQQSANLKAVLPEEPSSCSNRTNFPDTLQVSLADSENEDQNHSSAGSDNNLVDSLGSRFNFQSIPANPAVEDSSVSVPESSEMNAHVRSTFPPAESHDSYGLKSEPLEVAQTSRTSEFKSSKSTATSTNVNKLSDENMISGFRDLAQSRPTPQIEKQYNLSILSRADVPTLSIRDYLYPLRVAPLLWFAYLEVNSWPCSMRGYGFTLLIAFVLVLFILSIPKVSLPHCFPAPLYFLRAFKPESLERRTVASLLSLVHKRRPDVCIRDGSQLRLLSSFTSPLMPTISILSPKRQFMVASAREFWAKELQNFHRQTLPEAISSFRQRSFEHITLLNAFFVKHLVPLIGTSLRPVEEFRQSIESTAQVLDALFVHDVLIDPGERLLVLYRKHFDSLNVPCDVHEQLLQEMFKALSHIEKSSDVPPEVTHNLISRVIPDECKSYHADLCYALGKKDDGIKVPATLYQIFINIHVKFGRKVPIPLSRQVLMKKEEFCLIIKDIEQACTIADDYFLATLESLRDWNLDDIQHEFPAFASRLQTEVKNAESSVLVTLSDLSDRLGLKYFSYLETRILTDPSGSVFAEIACVLEETLKSFSGAVSKIVNHATKVINSLVSWNGDLAAKFACQVEHTTTISSCLSEALQTIPNLQTEKLNIVAFKLLSRTIRYVPIPWAHYLINKIGCRNNPPNA